MNQLLEEFWKWANITPEEYAQDVYGQRDRFEEDNFDHFIALVAYAKQIVNQNFLSADDLDDLITIMAIDNESEMVLEYVKENSSNEQLEQIISMGMVHLQPQARWQIAELIFARKPIRYIEKLNSLTKDSHPYVRKRAKNCIDFVAHGTGDDSLCSN